MFSGLHDSALYQSHPLFLETWCCLSINSLGVLESTTAAAPKTSLQNIIYLLVLVGHVVRNGKVYFRFIGTNCFYDAENERFTTAPGARVAVRI